MIFFYDNIKYSAFKSLTSNIKFFHDIASFQKRTKDLSLRKAYILWKPIAVGRTSAVYWSRRVLENLSIFALPHIPKIFVTVIMTFIGVRV